MGACPLFQSKSHQAPAPSLRDVSPPLSPRSLLLPSGCPVLRPPGSKPLSASSPTGRASLASQRLPYLSFNHPSLPGMALRISSQAELRHVHHWLKRLTVLSPNPRFLMFIKSRKATALILLRIGRRHLSWAGNTKTISLGSPLVGHHRNRIRRAPTFKILLLHMETRRTRIRTLSCRLLPTRALH